MSTMSMFERAEERTLLLLRAYEPVKVISWQRAFALLTQGKVEVLEEYSADVRTTHYVFKMPAVVRLLRAFKRFQKPVKFSRVNIYARDEYRCQYCGFDTSSTLISSGEVTPTALATWLSCSDNGRPLPSIKRECVSAH